MPGAADTAEQPDFGNTADAVVALSAAGAAKEAMPALEWLEKNSAAWAKENGPAAYAQLVLAARATETDPRKFGSVDLVEQLNAAGPAPKSPDTSASSTTSDDEDSGFDLWWIIGIGTVVGVGIGFLLSGRRSDLRRRQDPHGRDHRDRNHRGRDHHGQDHRGQDHHGQDHRQGRGCRGRGATDPRRSRGRPGARRRLPLLVVLGERRRQALGVRHAGPGDRPARRRRRGRLPLRGQPEADDTARPTAAPDFTRICGDVAAKDGTKRVAVVVDFGGPADAPPGEARRRGGSPPAARSSAPTRPARRPSPPWRSRCGTTAGPCCAGSPATRRGAAARRWAGSRPPRPLPGRSTTAVAVRPSACSSAGRPSWRSAGRRSGRPAAADEHRPARGALRSALTAPVATRANALHAGAWWLWALGLAVAASRTTNPLLLGLIVGVAGYVVAARRTDAPWARSYGAFVKLGLFVVALRVVFSLLLGSPIPGTHLLFTLPEVPLPDWAQGCGSAAG